MLNIILLIIIVAASSSGFTSLLIYLKQEHYNQKLQKSYPLPVIKNTVLRELMSKELDKIKEEWK
jgi:hypothetical protein